MQKMWTTRFAFGGMVRDAGGRGRLAREQVLLGQQGAERDPAHAARQPREEPATIEEAEAAEAGGRVSGIDGRCS